MPKQPPAQPGKLNLVYVDRPEVPETFVDSLQRTVIDGVHARMEFVVNRLDDPKPPACRLASLIPHVVLSFRCLVC